MKAIKVILISILTAILLGLLFILIQFGHADIPIKKLKSKYGTDHSEFMNVMGMNVHYTIQASDSTKPSILLIHGTGASLHTFDIWAEELQKEYRVIRMDLPAYGLTGPFPNGDYSITHYVEFLDKFTSRLGLNHFMLAGNSLGGQIAWNYAVNYQNKVDKLVLIDAAGYPLEANSIPIAFKIARIPIIRKVFTYITPRSIVKSSVENVYADTSKITDELIDRYFELSLREGNRQAFIDRLSSHGKVDNSNKISSIKIPTLILWGADDNLIPVKYAYRFQKDLQNAQLEITPNTGHVPMEESPYESLKAVSAFFKAEN